jgi:hypothetical protein
VSFVVENGFPGKNGRTQSCKWIAVVKQSIAHEEWLVHLIRFWGAATRVCKNSLATENTESFEKKTHKSLWTLWLTHLIRHSPILTTQPHLSCQFVSKRKL